MCCEGKMVELDALLLLCAALVKKKKMWDRKRYSHLWFPAADESKFCIAEWKLKSAKPETQQKLYKVLETHQEGSCCSRFGTRIFWSTKGKSEHFICSTPIIWIWFQIMVSIYLCHHTSCAFVETVAKTWFLNYVVVFLPLQMEVLWKLLDYSLISVLFWSTWFWLNKRD